MVPAAHSTDTTWYAVDENGEVALFDTGEPGAVPERAGLMGGQSATEPEAYPLFFMEALSAARALDAEPLSDPDPLRPGFALLAFEDAAIDLARWNLTRVHHGRRLWAITRETVSQARLEELRTAGAFVIPQGSGFLYEFDPGITRYSCEDYDVPGRYTRDRLAPLKASELPDAVRAPIEKLKLPLKFDQTEELQLADVAGIGELAIWGDLGPRGEGLDAVAPGATPEAPPRRQPSVTLGLIGIGIVLLLMLLALLLNK
jgi:hypothetical protein